jgi:hypothetical protein
MYATYNECRWHASFAGLLLGVLVCCTGQARDQAGAAKPTAFDALKQLPVGLKVVHTPNPVRASLSAASQVRKKYTWWYETAVTATDADVTIVEFGSYVWQNDRWAFSNFSGKPFSAKEFAEWYACPGALIKKGASCADQTNWGSAAELVSGKALWYFIGVDNEGRRVKGEAVIEQLPEIDPTRPNDDAFKKNSESSQFIDLFNGHDLSHWVVEGTTTDDAGRPVWTVRDGAIQCAGSGFGFLRSELEYADFTLQLQFRLERGVNSGVGIRHGKFTGARHTRPSYAGYEIQLLDDAGQRPTTSSTGSLYRYVAPKHSAMKPAGQWNDMTVQCRGPLIKIELNGKIIQDVDQRTVERIADKPLKGYFSLQNHGGEVAFRKIRIKTAD